MVGALRLFLFPALSMSIYYIFSLLTLQSGLCFLKKILLHFMVRSDKKMKWRQNQHRT